MWTFIWLTVTQMFLAFSIGASFSINASVPDFPEVDSDDELEDEAVLSEETGELQDSQRSMIGMKKNAKQILYFFILFISFSFSRYHTVKI